VLVSSARPILIAFFTFLVLQDPLRILSGGEDTQLGFLIKRADEALLFPLAAWAFFSSPDARAALRSGHLGLAIGASFFGMILSTLVVGQELIPAAMDLALFSKPFLLFTIGASITMRESDVRRRLPWLVGAMLVVVSFALVFLLFPKWLESYIGDLRSPDERMGFASAQGFFEHAGVYSWFCVATFGIAYAAGLVFRKNAYLIAALIAAGFTVFSWRRKSIAGILAILIIAVLVKSQSTVQGRRRAVAILALVIVIAATALAPFLTSLWNLTVSDYIEDPYATARVALHYTSVLIAIDHFPLGSGLASFGSHASRVYYSPVYHEYGLSRIWGLSPTYPAFITDTFWPMVLGQGGIVTLVPYVVFVALLVSCCWKRSRIETSSAEDRFLALASLFVLVGSLLESTSSHIYDSTMQSALALVLPGVTWSRAVVPPSWTQTTAEVSQKGR
jgi:hypothetical protein